MCRQLLLLTTASHCCSHFFTSLRLYRFPLLSLVTFSAIFLSLFLGCFFFLLAGPESTGCHVRNLGFRRKKVVTVFLGAVAVPGCPCSPLQRARQVFAEVGAAGVPSCGQRNCTSCQTFAQKACWLHPPARRHRRASRHFGKQLLVTGAVSCTLLQFFRCGLLPHGLVGFL